MEFNRKLNTIHGMHKIFLMVMMAAIAGGAGCSDSKKATLEAEVKASDGGGVDVDYSYKEKDKFASKLKKELSEINAEIERAGRDMKAEAKPRIEKLKDKARNLDVEIEKVENATEETWNDIKAGSRKAFEEIKAGFRDAREWTAEKIK